MSKIIGGIFLIIFVLLFGGISIFYNVWLGYSYEKTVGAHFENAFEINTPERMIDELELAKQGMRDLGLTEDMYGALIFKKPDNSMSYQFEYIDSIIERAESVIEWKGVQNQREQMTDVYEQKMDNLREFIKEGGSSDWIAKPAWWINKHIVWYIFRIPLFFFMGLLAIIGFILICAGLEDY